MPETFMILGIAWASSGNPQLSSSLLDYPKSETRNPKLETLDRVCRTGDRLDTLRPGDRGGASHNRHEQSPSGAIHPRLFGEQLSSVVGAIDYVRSGGN